MENLPPLSGTVVAHTTLKAHASEILFLMTHSVAVKIMTIVRFSN